MKPPPSTAGCGGSWLDALKRIQQAAVRHTCERKFSTNSICPTRLKMHSWQKQAEVNAKEVGQLVVWPGYGE
eukprot:scaffold80965_cov21-Tisochrysis_lutea.AAC.1